MSGVAGHLSLILLFAYLTLSHADDRFTCCMGGWKVMRGVTLCAAPCCPGYQQKTLKMPLLDSPVICQKLTEEELKQQEEARMTTTPPAEPKNVLDDQPRRIIRASSEYEEFLYRHRHFFLHLMNEGYSRKELLTNMEQFLNKISSVLYQPDWYRG
ncbi:uncharacterized protein LOC121854360 [Homarus americanus]|uniref:Uncharacterized protein n=1 Tax=Homarus americanus TaxID=6706 RepID=A0A8J5JCI3_HOMAM|nr:uncharacterized protein LOC121854360 [Homarus americanus]KAG7155927.1 hypothetical protein Hamer_G012070 [Homarus americanus]